MPPWTERKYRKARKLCERDLILVTLAVVSGASLDAALHALSLKTLTPIVPPGRRPGTGVRQGDLNPGMALGGIALRRKVSEELALEVERAARVQYKNWDDTKAWIVVALAKDKTPADAPVVILLCGLIGV